ncbi:glycosyl hydrolase catalytic core-domain-containing protein [Verticillium dahliae]|nr:glycosyl hydrolase catalytic core-domain-containing protein [Verticillium dahliae]
MCESCSWAYNWDSRDNGLIGRGLDFVPMLWSPADDHTQRWKLNVEDMIRKGVSNSNLAGEGLEWLQAWVDVCKEKGCAYDFCPIHWYSFPESTADLFHHIQRASAICGGKPIWLTEFSSLPLSQGGREVAEWLRGQLPKLDLLASLERYAFFMVDGKLVANGLPTPAGAVYAA